MPCDSKRVEDPLERQFCEFVERFPQLGLQDHKDFYSNLFLCLRSITERNRPFSPACLAEMEFSLVDTTFDFKQEEIKAEMPPAFSLKKVTDEHPKHAVDINLYLQSMWHNSRAFKNPSTSLAQSHWGELIKFAGTSIKSTGNTTALKLLAILFMPCKGNEAHFELQLQYQLLEFCCMHATKPIPVLQTCIQLYKDYGKIKQVFCADTVHLTIAAPPRRRRKPPASLAVPSAAAAQPVTPHTTIK